MRPGCLPIFRRIVARERLLLRPALFRRRSTAFPGATFTTTAIRTAIDMVGNALVILEFGIAIADFLLLRDAIIEITRLAEVILGAGDAFEDRLENAVDELRLVAAVANDIEHLEPHQNGAAQLFFRPAQFADLGQPPFEQRGAPLQYSARACQQLTVGMGDDVGKEVFGNVVENREAAFESVEAHERAASDSPRTGSFR